MKEFFENNIFKIVVDSKKSSQILKKAIELTLLKNDKKIEDSKDAFVIGLNNKNSNLNIEGRYISKKISKIIIDSNFIIDDEISNLLLESIMIETNSVIYKVAEDNGMEIFHKLQQKANPYKIFNKINSKTKDDLNVIIKIYENVSINKNFNFVSLENIYEDIVTKNLRWFLEELNSINNASFSYIEFENNDNFYLINNNLKKSFFKDKKRQDEDIYIINNFEIKNLLREIEQNV